MPTGDPSKALTCSLWSTQRAHRILLLVGTCSNNEMVTTAGLTMGPVARTHQPHARNAAQRLHQCVGSIHQGFYRIRYQSCPPSPMTEGIGGTGDRSSINSILIPIDIVSSDPISRGSLLSHSLFFSSPALLDAFNIYLCTELLSLLYLLHFCAIVHSFFPAWSSIAPDQSTLPA